MIIWGFLGLSLQFALLGQDKTDYNYIKKFYVLSVLCGTTLICNFNLTYVSWYIWSRFIGFSMCFTDSCSHRKVTGPEIQLITCLFNKEV